MWRQQRRNEDGRSLYAVLVHAQGLLITDNDGVERIGGAYTWRFVSATTRKAAAEEAIKSLLTTPAFVAEVRNLEDALAEVSVDEIVPVDRQDESRGTGVVFYIDTDTNA